MFRVLQNRTLDHVREVLRGQDHPISVADKLAAPCPIGVTITGAIRYEVDIVYAGAIFRSILDVEPSGEVKMIDDEPLCEPIDALKEPLAMVNE